MQQVSSGVYVIRNTISGKCYIGSAANLRVRWNGHVSALKRQGHDNRHLQRAWNLYGADCFVFSLLLYCHEDDRVWFEQRAIDFFLAKFGRRHLYNLSPTASCVRGVRRTKETRRKLSELGKGRRHSPETREKMRLAAIGNTRNVGRKPSEEHRAKLSAAMKGRQVTWGEKISAGQKGRVLTPEHRAKLSQAAKRQKWTDERRAKWSQRMQGNKIAVGNKNGVGYVYTPEQREARRLRALGNKNGAGNNKRASGPSLAQRGLFGLFLIVGCLAFTASVNAQTVQDDPVAKALEQAVARLALAEEKNRLLEDRLKAKDATILGLEGVVKVRDQQLELALSANKDRAVVNTGDARMLQACENQLAKADREISRLRNPGFFRSIFDPKVITGAALGFGVGRLTK